MPLIPDQDYSTLQQIQTKVRRLTRSLSENQLSTTELNNYINTFILYDFPEHLRLFNLKTTLTFFTQPFVDTYETNTTDVNDPLYNFKNKYVSLTPPAYVAGYQTLWSQSREQFFGIYPMLNTIGIVASGDGVTTTFTGYVNTGNQNIQPFVQNSGQQALILRDNVLFSSIDASGNGLQLVDYPVSNTTGALGLPGTPQTLPSPYGQINYTTGAFTAHFPTPPALGQAINSQVVIVQPTLPQAILFYDTKLTFRPVPDQSYRINIEAYIRPTELLSQSSSPELAEYWQFIAYGAAKKIFEDRMDTDSVVQIMPEFHEQMMLIQRRTIVQQTNQRSSTIYANSTNQPGSGYNGWFSSGSNI